MQNYVLDLFVHYYTVALGVSHSIKSARFELLPALYFVTSSTLKKRFSESECKSILRSIKSTIFSDYISAIEESFFFSRCYRYIDLESGCSPIGVWTSNTLHMIPDLVTDGVILLGDYLYESLDQHGSGTNSVWSFSYNPMSYLYDLFRAYFLQLSLLPASKITGSKLYSACYTAEIPASVNVIDHFFEEQTKRRKRSQCLSSNWKTIDAKAQSGTFSGSSNQPYTVTRDSCTCLDFKKRRLPCKHMYSLTDELDSLAEKDHSHSLFVPCIELEPIIILKKATTNNPNGLDHIGGTPPEKNVTVKTNEGSATRDDLSNPVLITEIAPANDKNNKETDDSETKHETESEQSFKEKVKDYFLAVLSIVFTITVLVVLPLLLIVSGLKSCIDENKEKILLRQTSTTNNFTYWYIPEQQDTTDYVLNTSSMIVHNPWCSKVPNINPDNYKTCKNLSSALNQGYRRCELCDPCEVGITETKAATSRALSSSARHPVTTTTTTFSAVTSSITFPTGTLPTLSVTLYTNHSQGNTTHELSPEAQALLDDWNRQRPERMKRDYLRLTNDMQALKEQMLARESYWDGQDKSIRQRINEASTIILSLEEQTEKYGITDVYDKTILEDYKELMTDYLSVLDADAEQYGRFKTRDEYDSYIRKNAAEILNDSEVAP